MRQPKFKGFSRGANSWHYGFGWCEIDYTEDFLKEKGIQPQALLYRVNSSPIECELSSMGEYIGLKDVYEKEIYEGDVVQYVDDYHVKRTGIVVFRNGSFAIQNPYITSYRLTDYSIEIIGNKFNE